MNNLFNLAYNCIRVTEPLEKIQLTQTIAQAWQLRQLNLESSEPIKSISIPGYPARLRLVPPREVPWRNLLTSEGQAALLHALTHIEFNAINLAWDAVYRFRDLPDDFYDDWVKVAQEEAYHFELLQQQLQQLGYQYGDFTAHNGLWDMAVKTTSDLLERMALVPRFLEARGLDATPTLITKFQSQGLTPIVAILKIILRDEIEHVAIGSRWFKFCCQARELNSEMTFQDLVTPYLKGRIKPPFNIEARLAAGFTQQDLNNLSQLAKVS
ncbi:MAG: ferritin-like domain-containing protein [Thioploca sp.]|nr:ferritin-like domain-containing protein [Thioploca sp.]